MDAGAAPVLRVRGRELQLTGTLIMGVVNASPESFSDGGVRSSLEQQLELSDQLISAGADIIDVGGHSAVTNQPEIDADEERDRVLPIVEWLAHRHPDVLISVDTYKTPVAEACLAAGAGIINDVSGLAYPDLLAPCVRHGSALVVMHTAARPKQRLQRPDLYHDVVREVIDFLAQKMAVALDAGLPLESIIVDPGPDFAKTPHQTLAILRNLDEVRALGRPVLLALSRKDFLGAILQKPPRARDAGTRRCHRLPDRRRSRQHRSGARRSRRT